MIGDATPIVHSPLHEHEDMSISPSHDDQEMHTPYLDSAVFSPYFASEEEKK